MEEKQKLGADEQFCSSCGEAIKKESEICPKCGVRIKEPPAATSEKKKSSKFKIGCLSIIGAIVVLTVIAVLVPSGEQDSGGAARLYPDRPDSQDKDTEIAAGETGVLSGWEVTVSFKEVASSLGTFKKAELGSRFVVFDVTVKRIGDKTSKLLGQNSFGSEFRLVSPGGQVINPAFSGKKPELAPGDMVSGGQVNGYLTYEVPTKSGMHYLLFKPGKFSSSRLVWGIEIP